MEISLARRKLPPVPGLPKVELPEVVVRLPGKIEAKWEELELVSIEFCPAAPKGTKFIFKEKRTQ